MRSHFPIVDANQFWGTMDSANDYKWDIDKNNLNSNVFHIKLISGYYILIKKHISKDFLKRSIWLAFKHLIRFRYKINMAH